MDKGGVILEKTTPNRIEMFHLGDQSKLTCTDYSVEVDKKEHASNCFPQYNRGTGVYKYNAYFNLYLLVFTNLKFNKT